MSTTSGSMRGGGAAAVGIAMAVLTLAGCRTGTAAVASGAGAGATSPVATSAVPVVQLPSASATMTPASATAPPATSAPQTTSAEPPLSSIPPRPTPTACPFPEKFFVRIVSVGFDIGNSHSQIVAQPAKGLCGGGLPDDAEYTVTGPAVDYDVSPGVKITGIGPGGQPVSETWAQFAASSLGEYGGFYGIDVNGGVEVTVIDAYFHP